MNTETPPKLSNSTRLYITEPVQLTKCHNHTAVEFIDQKQAQWQIIIITSALMNGLLIIVVIVFAAGQTERLEKHIHNTDLQTKVIYQPK
ncbi:hypothetical protein QQF64_018936 [Cirrhinus molitorella]|uniref:Uncharacterized protein n=1 Tax=Cirrhinus molitorella TaxID=172907 RepID=A0ABR3LFL9_9TELE